MAIFFPSPQKRQRIFARVINVTLVAGLFLFSLLIFPPQLNYRDQRNEGSFDQQLSINFNVVDSERVKNLELFDEIPNAFDFTAQESNGREITGQISAVNTEEARAVLEDTGLSVLEIKESGIGRNQPFTPYYIQ